MSTSTSYINRYWSVQGENIAEYENVLTGTYLASDLVGSVAAVRGSTFDNEGWHFYASQGLDMTISDRINGLDGDFTGQDYHGTLNVKVNLQGAYDAGNDIMLTSLNNKGLLPGEVPTIGGVTPTPSGHPYQVSPWNFTDFTMDSLGDGAGQYPYPSEVVDYVLVSVLEGGNNVNQDVIFTSVGLLNSDGSIQIAEDRKFVNLTSLGPFYVFLEHRNHLPVLDTLSNFNGVLTHDFTAEDSYLESQGSNAVGQVKIGNIYTMAAGNGAQGQTPSARYFISSIDQFIWKLGQNSEGYLLGDHNLNGGVSSIDEFLWNINQNFESEIPR